MPKEIADQNQRVLVSIGVPTYNVGEGIHRSIESLQRQTYTNIEILVSDDCSTDETRCILNKIAERDSRVHISVNSCRIGAVGNFNATLAKARGALFFWHAQDDFRDPSFIEMCVDEFHRDSDLTYCSSLIRDKGARMYHRDLIAPSALFTTLKTPWARFVWAHITRHGSIGFYGMFRTDFLRGLGGWRSGPSADILLFNNAILSGRARILPRVAFQYNGLGVVRSTGALRSFMGADSSLRKIPPSLTFAIETLKMVVASRLGVPHRVALLVFIAIYEPGRFLLNLLFRILRRIMGDRMTRELYFGARLSYFCDLMTRNRYNLIEAFPRDVDQPEVEGYCRICERSTNGQVVFASDNISEHSIRFEYHHCKDCGTLSSKFPEEVSLLGYPTSYTPHRKIGPLRSALHRCNMLAHYYNIPIFKTLFSALFGRPDALCAMSAAGVPLDSRILEVGCGGGALLDNLEALGFESLTGLDPISIPRAKKDSKIVFHNCLLSQHTGEYDLIILSHVIEHIFDVRQLVRELKRNLRRGGQVLVLTPVSDCEAFELYRGNWVQIDAPRHQTILSRPALLEVFNREGFNTVSQCSNSTEFQFLGSRDVERGRMLVDGLWSYRGGVWARLKLLWLKWQYLPAVRQVNRFNRGDQVAMLFAENGSAR